MSSIRGQRHREQVPDAAAAPAPGEAIHVPGESVWPLLVGIGITLMVIGITIWWVWSAIGGVIAFGSGGLWIRDAHREFEALPDGDERH